MNKQIQTAISKKFRIIRSVGEDWFGTLYEAELNNGGKKVLLKVQRPEIVGLDLSESLFNSLKKASLLFHPNLAKFVTIEQTPNGVFYAQDFLGETTLQSELKQSPRYSLKDVLGLMKQILSGLSAIHKLKLVHGYLNPSNIYFATSPSGKRVVKLIDYAVVDMQEFIQSDQIIKNYMSPEQALGEEGLDSRTDVFAAGAVFFELLTGKKAYEAVGDEDVSLKIILKSPPPVEKIVSTVPKDVAAVVNRALHNDLDERYRDISSFLKDVIACQKRLTDGTDKKSARLAPKKPSLQAVGKKAKAALSDRLSSKSGPAVPLSVSAEGSAKALSPATPSAVQSPIPPKRPVSNASLTTQLLSKEPKPVVGSPVSVNRAAPKATERSSVDDPLSKKPDLKQPHPKRMKTLLGQSAPKVVQPKRPERIISTAPVLLSSTDTPPPNLGNSGKAEVQDLPLMDVGPSRSSPSPPETPRKETLPVIEEMSLAEVSFESVLEEPLSSSDINTVILLEEKADLLDVKTVSLEEIQIPETKNGLWDEARSSKTSLASKKLEEQNDAAIEIVELEPNETDDTSTPLPFGPTEGVVFGDLESHQRTRTYPSDDIETEEETLFSKVPRLQVNRRRLTAAAIAVVLLFGLGVIGLAVLNGASSNRPLKEGATLNTATKKGFETPRMAGVPDPAPLPKTVSEPVAKEVTSSDVNGMDEESEIQEPSLEALETGVNGDPVEVTENEEDIADLKVPRTHTKNTMKRPKRKFKKRRAKKVLAEGWAANPFKRH